MVSAAQSDTFDLQSETLRLFLAMRLYRPSWSRTLLLGVGLGGPGRALALATRAAGAAGLFLDDDAAQLRQAQREGCSNFTVTALEEAIRILKNEVRQGRAIAVALRQDPATAMAEMLHRGLQPDVLAFSRAASPAERTDATALQRLGAVPLAGYGLSPGAGAADLPSVLQLALEAGWRIHTDTAPTYSERRQRDADLRAAAESRIESGTPLAALATEWLRVAPGFLPRSLERRYVLPCTFA